MATMRYPRPNRYAVNPIRVLYQKRQHAAHDYYKIQDKQQIIAEIQEYIITNKKLVVDSVKSRNSKRGAFKKIVIMLQK